VFYYKFITLTPSQGCFKITQNKTRDQTNAKMKYQLRLTLKPLKNEHQQARGLAVSQGSKCKQSAFGEYTQSINCSTTDYERVQ
jgi:hypothetical protein